MPCRSRECGCGIVSNSLQITGDGNPWQIEAGGATVGTQAQRLGVTPFQGLVWHEGDTGRTWLYDGTAWRIQHDPEPTTRLTFTDPSATDSTTSATATLWVTLDTDIVVPSWATAVEALWVIGGIWAVGGSGLISIYPRLDGAAPDNGTRVVEFMTNNQRITSSVLTWWTGLTPNDVLTPSLWAAAANGVPVRFDTSCRVDVRFDWREA